MAHVGSRLREERERLKLTQEAFATACGVGRRAQVTYESDERSPDARYLEAASKIGVDIAYVIYGGKTDFDETIRLMVIEDLFFCVCFELGFDSESVQALVNESTPVAKALYKKQKDAGGAAPYLIDSVKNFLGKSARITPHNRPDDLLNVGLLETVIEQLEDALRKSGFIFSPAKKARAAAMLYRSFKSSGLVDKKMVDEIIALASS